MPKKTGWDELDGEGFFDSELLILSDDGEAACFVPMGEPTLESEKAFGKTIVKAVVPVIRCGDAEPEEPGAWYAQEARFGKRQARAYRTLAEGQEGKVMLRITRHGEPNSQDTKYTFELVDKLPDDLQKKVAEIDAGAKK